ncbi:hypothetical protein CLV30_13153 [Haloactinopolyspora alba]|uniref:Uncharacterized protein n=1 Tax=Haloactinopolyspora alba TaxID=648780 RepID=A0A2P8D719_9ACTN|nr:hypothetical protein [Haloactinopolyspora alba]PSK93026.1 hypothetical protein CLV30_13153 [Haloactinopolyspora alba]
MARAIYYPKADRTAQWFGQGNATITPNKGLWHTTETGSWPGYSGGASAPQLTYDPRKREWRQHFPLNRSARALRNDGRRQTNREDVVQIEIVCSSDESFAQQYGYPHVTELSDGAIEDLAEYVAWMHREWDVPITAAENWLPYPASYGDTSARMSWSQFAAFQGWLGHLHAPGNTHGDPGALPVDRIIERARQIVGGEEEDEMTSEEVQAAVRAGLLQALEDAQTRRNPYGRKFGDILNALFGRLTRRHMKKAIEAAADRDSPYGRQLGTAIHRATNLSGVPATAEEVETLMRRAMDELAATLVENEGAQ